jgi:hypothetical protein
MVIKFLSFVLREKTGLGDIMEGGVLQRTTVVSITVNALYHDSVS